MPEHVETEQNKRLRSKFDFEKLGFYGVVPYIDAQIGFGCKKKLNPQDTENVSGVGIYIPNQVFQQQGSRKAFFITATYGKEIAEGIQLRGKHDLSEPIDLEFRDEFFYDIESEKLFKKEREITANDLLTEVYKKHIKPTKFFEGFSLRLELRFWQEWLPGVFKFVSSIFHYSLFIVSGDKYTYEFLFKEENLNGTIISSEMKGRIGRTREVAKGQEKEEEAKKIEFFGITVPQWPIVFYSVLHLCAYFLAVHFGLFTTAVKSFFDNNFLVVLYVVVSFWLIETVLPYLLKKLIKGSSTLAFLSSVKKINV